MVIPGPSCCGVRLFAVLRGRDALAGPRPRDGDAPPLAREDPPVARDDPPAAREDPPVAREDPLLVRDEAPLEVAPEEPPALLPVRLPELGVAAGLAGPRRPGDDATGRLADRGAPGRLEVMPEEYDLRQ